MPSKEHIMGGYHLGLASAEKSDTAGVPNRAHSNDGDQSFQLMATSCSNRWRPVWEFQDAVG
jgi:hypothetical protein